MIEWRHQCPRGSARAPSGIVPDQRNCPSLLCPGTVWAPLAGLGSNINENKCLAGVTVVTQTLRNKHREPGPSLISERNLLLQADAGGRGKGREGKGEQLLNEDENTGQKICGSHLFANLLLDRASMCILGSFSCCGFIQI